MPAKLPRPPPVWAATAVIACVFPLVKVLDCIFRHGLAVIVSAVSVALVASAIRKLFN